mmetsp:Transcript_8151/g.29488  ORF Transcript_8151/g.29488 Transcript_8151/m.29488 type:complete len:417 (-) Transcript_8151:2506-3756(-)
MVSQAELLAEVHLIRVLAHRERSKVLHGVVRILGLLLPSRLGRKEDPKEDVLAQGENANDVVDACLALQGLHSGPGIGRGSRCQVRQQDHLEGVAHQLRKDDRAVLLSVGISPHEVVHGVLHSDEAVFLVPHAVEDQGDQNVPRDCHLISHIALAGLAKAHLALGGQRHEVVQNESGQRALPGGLLDKDLHVVPRFREQLHAVAEHDFPLGRLSLGQDPEQDGDRVELRVLAGLEEGYQPLERGLIQLHGGEFGPKVFEQNPKHGQLLPPHPFATAKEQQLQGLDANKGVGRSREGEKQACTTHSRQNAAEAVPCHLLALEPGVEPPDQKRGDVVVHIVVAEAQQGNEVALVELLLRHDGYGLQVTPSEEVLADPVALGVRADLTLALPRPQHIQEVGNLNCVANEPVLRPQGPQK